MDVSKFVHISAQHYYTDVLQGKTFVLERELKPDKEDGQLKEMIRVKGWALFVGTPLAAPMAIVHEFYANAK